MPMDILEIYTLQKMATPNMEAKRGWNFSQWIHSSLTLRLKSSHKGNLEIRKISLLFLKCSNIQCRNHDSGFFTTSQIIEKWLSIFFTEISPQNQGSVMADTGQEGGAENTAGRTSALRAAWGFSCAFKAQAESQRPAGHGREAWPTHTCGTLRPASASKASHPQRACSVALVADGPRSRPLHENESRRQACSSNLFALKHGQERGHGHWPNGALGLEISPFSSQKQIVK